MRQAILAIDQGTTNSKAILLSGDGLVLSQGSSPVGIKYPQPGWVEQCPARIWQSVLEAVALCRAGAPDVAIMGIAISNQRESVTIWDAVTGQSLGPMISWQCRRTTRVCNDLLSEGYGARVMAMTGLPLDPMFPAAKLRWLLDHARAVGRIRLGTVDSWLIHRLTDGRVHACDASNAARTQILDLQTGQWSAELCGLFGVPMDALPDVRDSSHQFGVTLNVPGLPDGIPICAAIGDSHAALFGHGAFGVGDTKVTFGTGSSIMSTVNGFIPPRHGITTTVAWSLNGQKTYGFEGNILVSASSLPWMANILGLPDVEALTDLAASAEPGGPGFVPAFVGLGAPHWAPDARALFSNISFTTSRAQMARAVTDSLGLQVRDVLRAIAAQSPTALGCLYVDGGPSRNRFLMQTVADILDHPLMICTTAEASAVGAGYLGGLALGLWSSLDAIAALPRDVQPVHPSGDRSAPDRLIVWDDAIRRSTLS